MTDFNLQTVVILRFANRLRLRQLSTVASSPVNRPGLDGCVNDRLTEPGENNGCFYF